MNFSVQREELATLQFLIANYFPTKDAAQAQAVLSRLAAIADIEAQYSLKLAVEQELEALKRAISEAEPVAWMRDDGEPGSISTMTNCCSAKVKNLWIKVNPIQIERYTVPLYTLKGIK